MDIAADLFENIISLWLAQFNPTRFIARNNCMASHNSIFLYLGD